MSDKDRVTDNKIGELESLCRERGLPLTVQRRTVMRALARRTDHPCADQVYDEVGALLPGISRTTVYRVLETFVSLGVARKISNAEARSRFDADTTRHHHIQCVRCGAVTDVRHAALDTLSLPDCEDAGFTILDYSVSFTGICAACRTAAEVDDVSPQPKGKEPA